MKIKEANANVIIAVVPFKIEAKPLSMTVCPHEIRENGITLFKIPIINNTPHCFKFGIGILKNATINQSVKHAQNTLFATRVKTGTSRKINA